jgi:predicted nucleic acid-binding protein
VKIYFDTGLLLKLYVAEENSGKAVALVQKHGAPICFTGFQHAELRNALYRKCARKEIKPAELRIALKNIQSDTDAGVLVSPELDWQAVFVRANRLTDKFALSVPCRTLDILHVASVLELGMSSIATTDVRQISLARKARLKVFSF